MITNKCIFRSIKRSASDLLSCVLRMSDVSLPTKRRAVWSFTNVAQTKVILK